MQTTPSRIPSFFTDGDSCDAQRIFRIALSRRRRQHARRVGGRSPFGGVA